MNHIRKFMNKELSKLAKIIQFQKLNNYRQFSTLLLVSASAFLCLFPIGKAFSQTANAGLSESYLLRNVGARSLALAGAYTAVVNEPFGLFYNPAGLGFNSNKPMIATSLSFLQFGRSHSAIAYGQSFGKLGVGLGFNNFSSGSFTARDVKGNPLGNYSDWQYALNIGAAYTIDFASVGVGVKYLSNTLSGSGTEAKGYSVDFGTKFNVMDLFSFGLAVRNVAGMMSWNTESNHEDILPYIITSGLAMEFPLNEKTTQSRSTLTGELETENQPATRYILISFDGNLTQHELNPTFTLGIEAVPHEIIAFRGGIAIAGDEQGVFSLFPMTIWGGGISIRPQLDGLPFTTHIDYTISNDYMAINKISHHISLMFQF